jgi:hypothetical protein
MSRTVTYTLRSTSLGLLLVAASERGVCQVRFGASRSALEAALARELPCAALAREPFCAVLERWRTRWPRCEGRADTADVPLDVAGSRFQRRCGRAAASPRRAAVRRLAANSAREQRVPWRAPATIRAARGAVPSGRPEERRRRGYHFGSLAQAGILAVTGTSLILSRR